jgi:hypothetical protein
MADNTVVHIGENSPEKIAYLLMVDIINKEGGKSEADRKKILDTYAECLQAVRGYRTFPEHSK